MESAQIPAFPQPPLAAIPQLREKPRLGLPSKNPALNQGINEHNSTVAIGMRVGLALNAARQSGLARYYNSRTGTFCSADPLAGSPGDPQSWNRYPYGRNDPINITDPSGKSWWSSLLIDIGVGVASYFLGPEIEAWLGIGGGAAGGGAAAAQAQTAADVASGAAIPSATPGLFYRGATAAISAGADASAAGASGSLGAGLAGAAVAQGAQSDGQSNNGHFQLAGFDPNFVRKPLPQNAQDCSTNAGVKFNAPPGFSVRNIAANGRTNGLSGAGAAVGQGGYYDFQRYRVGSTTQFFPGYTPVANIAVGAYLQGAGASRWMGSAISNTYAFFKSSNGATAQQAQFRSLGYDLASGKGTYSCHPHQ